MEAISKSWYLVSFVSIANNQDVAHKFVEAVLPGEAAALAIAGGEAIASMVIAIVELIPNNELPPEECRNRLMPPDEFETLAKKHHAEMAQKEMN